MKATLKIPNGSQGWWLTPDGFFENDQTTPLDMESESAEELRRIICKRSFNLPRWAGEEGPYGTVSVGVHSLLVSFLAGRLATVRDCSDATVTAAKSIGAAHDLGERLGPGDIVSPILRTYPETKAINDGYQTLAFNLFELWGMWGTERFALSTRCIVKDADHLAAAIERRYLFDDNSGDCESPDASSLFDEIGGIRVWRGHPCVVKSGDNAESISGGPLELEKAIKCEL